MRKFGVLASTIFTCSVLAGLYGIIHDQVTYSISPEYLQRLSIFNFRLIPHRLVGTEQQLLLLAFWLPGGPVL